MMMMRIEMHFHDIFIEFFCSCRAPAEHHFLKPMICFYSTISYVIIIVIDF